MARNDLLLNRCSPNASREPEIFTKRQLARRRLSIRRRQLTRNPALAMLEIAKDKSGPERVKPRGAFPVNEMLGKAYGLTGARRTDKYCTRPCFTIIPYMGIFAVDFPHLVCSGIAGDFVSSFVSIIPKEQTVRYFGGLCFFFTLVWCHYIGLFVGSLVGLYQRFPLARAQN